MIYRFLWFSKGGLFRTNVELRTTGSSSPTIVQSAENVITFTFVPRCSGEASESTRSSPSGSSSAMGVDTSLEVSSCSADGPDSRVGRSVSSMDGPAFIAGLSAIPQKAVKLLSHFRSSWPFDLFQRPLASTFFAVVGTADVCY
jgi:hypothetical protein